MPDADCEFEFFMDESGLFLGRHEDAKQGFANQLAGVLAPKGKLNAKKAAEIIKSIKPPELEHRKDIHGKDIPSGILFDALISSLIEQLDKRGIKLIRIVNDDRVDFGSRIANYTNMFAELSVRICKALYHQKNKKIFLHVVADEVLLPHSEKWILQDSDAKKYMAAESYEQRLKEFLTRAALQQGFTDTRNFWEVSLELAYANRMPQLQIADLVSNASHGNCRKLGKEAEALIRSAFGPFDYTMSVSQIIESVDEHLAKDLLGPALRLITERICQKDCGGRIVKKLLSRLEIVIQRLCTLGESSRNAHLHLLIPWIEQMVNDKRELLLADKIIDWLILRVGTKLTELLVSEADSVVWFQFSLYRWSISCCNHRGDLRKAHAHAHMMDALSKKLAAQWEHAPLLLDGLVVQAVHFTDSLDYKRASQSMELVCEYYDQLSGLFNVVLPQVFPENIRSRQRAKALGSWMQAETKAGLHDSTRFANARRLSNRALEEFAIGSDQRRQQQYRCELEAYSGNFLEAKRYLAMSLDLPPDRQSFKDIAISIQAMDLRYQGFALLHLSRIGALAVKSFDEETWREFELAIDASGLLGSPWCSGTGSDTYPQHGVLRHIAVIRARKGQWENVKKVLRELQGLSKIYGSHILVAIELAARADVAFVCWETNNSFATNLISCSSQGLCKRLETLLKHCDSFPESFTSPLNQCYEILVPRRGVLSSPIEIKSAIFEFSKSFAY
jgi:hypothetical protein